MVAFGYFSPMGLLHLNTITETERDTYRLFLEKHLKRMASADRFAVEFFSNAELLIAFKAVPNVGKVKAVTIEVLETT